MILRLFVVEGRVLGFWRFWVVPFVSGFASHSGWRGGAAFFFFFLFFLLTGFFVVGAQGSISRREFRLSRLDFGLVRSFRFGF